MSDHEIDYFEWVQEVQGRVASLEGLVAQQTAQLDQHRFRIERLEQAFLALLDDVANNPSTAVERARASMLQHDEANAG